jgi:hypothetical protein
LSLQRYVLTFTDSFAATVISLSFGFAYTYRGGLKQLLSEYFTNFFFLVSSVF